MRFRELWAQERLDLVLKPRKEKDLSWSQNPRGADACQFCFKLDLVLAVTGYGRCTLRGAPQGTERGRSRVSLTEEAKKKKRLQSQGVV